MAKQLKINDIVTVIAGDHKGEKAKIVSIDRMAGRVCLENIGVHERHLRKSYFNPMGGKKTVQLGIALSNLKLETAAKYEKTAKDKAAKAAKSTKAADKKANAKKGAK